MMGLPADSTGSTTSKNEAADKIIPHAHFKFLPSIEEQGLSEKSNRKKLQTLFNRYLKPDQNASKSLDIQKAWGK